MRTYIILIVVATIALGLALFVFDKEEESLELTEAVTSHQLANGMKVIVVESHHAPVVVSQVWYKVGGSYEHDGITGVSHVVEHMMFKGTSDHPAGVFSEIIAANGGRENAFTSKDYTAYFQRIASDRLEICLSLEADRMRGLLLEEQEFIKEIEVIKEERRWRTDDKPTSLTYERFNAMAYANSPYRQPIIGWMEDLDSMKVEDLRDWYNSWYAPNNATLVVVGDVAAEQVFALAKKYFGPLVPAQVPESKPRKEVEQYGTQRMTVQLPARVPYLLMGYKVPVLKTGAEQWEAYALEVLSGLLDGGYSARLTRNLVRGKQLATSVGASYNLYALHNNMFTFSGVPVEEKTMVELEAAIKQEIKALQETAPEQKELDRVIAQVVASSVYEQDSSFYRAMQIGILETVGLGWRTKDEYVEKVKSVTAEQVQKVAKKYLVDKYLSVATLDPLPINAMPGKTQIDKNNGATGGRHGR
jgi:zinc protease